MMRVGRRRPGPDLAGWIGADALRLPFPDAAFDRVIVGYGLRNFPGPGRRRWPRASAACAPVAVSSRSTSATRGSRRCAAPTSATWTPRPAIVGWAIHRDPESYVYIPESLRSDSRTSGRWSAGWRLPGSWMCGHKDLMMGTMAINYGDHP